MKESLEVEGTFWLPTKPTKKILGTFFYNPGDIPKLILKGALNESGKEVVIPPEFITVDFVYGTTLQGEPITLFNCIQFKADGKTGLEGSYFQTEYIIHFAFFGVHLIGKTDMAFETLSIDFFNLKSWYNNNCIHTENPKSGTEIITFIRPNPIDIIVDGFQIQLNAFEGMKLQQNFASITTNPRIIIRGVDKKQFMEYMQLVRLIQNFFTFVITRPSFVIEMNGYISKHEESKQSFMPTKIYFSPIGWQPETKEIFWSNMMLSFIEIEDTLPTLLSEWIIKSELLKPVYDLYLANYYKNTYPENEFLNLTQAIETYHRRKFGGKYLSDEEYQSKLYKLLVNAIPEYTTTEFRNSLINGKLRYANEFSLRSRLLFLINQVSDRYDVDFLKSGKNSAFSKLIADTRNYLTHYSIELKEKAVTSGSALSDLNYKLDLIVRILLLEEIGVNSEKISAIIRKTKRY